MPRTIQSVLRKRRRFALTLVIIAWVSYLAMPGQPLKWLLPSASATTTSTAAKTNGVSFMGGASPGAISFAAQNFSVNEGDGSASITLTRTDGSAGMVSAKITLADVTTTPADYFFSPGSLDTTFTAPPQIGSIYQASSTALQPDGKIIAGDIRGVWRLNADGSSPAAYVDALLQTAGYRIIHHVQGGLQDYRITR